jgi:starch synthase
MSDSLHIVFAASEMVPYVKTGGLADVVGALPKALARLGHRVTVFLPRYGSIRFPPGDFSGSLHVPVDSLTRSAGFYTTRPHPNVQVVFVEHPPFFDRPYPYGEGNRDYEDNRLRFAFLSRAVLEFFRSRGERPSVFHTHDWQTGLLPVYLKAFYWDDPTLYRLPTVFTIHNLAYQGNFAADTLSVLGLPWHLGTAPALEFHGGISFMKGGLLFSERLTTVSPQYAFEVQGRAKGYGLDGVLRERSADFTGIVNGVDYDEWDPRHDPHIAQAYSADDLDGKAACKADLLRSFGLPEYPDLPLVGITSRLVPQKGFDLVTTAWQDILARPLRLVVLGTGDPDVQEGFREMARRAPDRVAVRFEYHGPLAHKIEAGSDMFLMPSRDEPCGLSQLYALRYGSVPIVHSAGGLVDTVEPCDAVAGTGTGFRFDDANGTGLMWALDQALGLWRDRAAWQALQRRGMARDFSWERSARAYEAIYREVIASLS